MREFPIEVGRYLAAQIPNAKFIEYPDEIMLLDRQYDALLGDIEEFVTGHRDSSSAELERVLATVLSPILSIQPEAPPLGRSGLAAIS